MPASAASPERETRLRSRLPEQRERKILTPVESKKLKKGMSPKMKMLLATGVALAGTTVVGGVVAKQRFDAMTPVQQLDFANSIIGRTSWSPWLSGRIRSMRDAGVLRSLNDPNAGVGQTGAERLALANRVIAGTADSPQVSAAVKAKRDAAITAEFNRGITDLGARARTWMGSLQQRTGPTPQQPPK